MRLIVRRIALYVVTAIVAITINFFLRGSCRATRRSQAPVIPLVYGAAWYEYSTRDYTGWPTASNPYIDPVPRIASASMSPTPA